MQVPDVYPLLKYAELHPRQPARRVEDNSAEISEGRDLPIPEDTHRQVDEPTGRPRRATLTQRIGDAFRGKLPSRTQSVSSSKQQSETRSRSRTGNKSGNDSMMMDVSSSESEEETVLHHRPMTLNQVGGGGVEE